MSDDISTYPHTHVHPDLAPQAEQVPPPSPFTAAGHPDHVDDRRRPEAGQPDDDQQDDLEPIGAGAEVAEDVTDDEDDLDEGAEPRGPYAFTEEDDEDDEDLDDELDEDDLDEDDLDPADDLAEDAADGPRSAPAPTFADLGVRDDIVASLAQVGITHPFPIQTMTLPVALSGHDVIGQAKTGTGKTLGFGIPLLQRVAGPGEPGWDALPAAGKPQALVIVPTRELAVQVAGDLDTAAKKSSARVLTVYGGRAYEPQTEALRRGVDVVVGTPGRLLDLAQQGHLNLGHARMVVLDEADEMLDLGFLPDVERLLALTPAGRQTLLFSATMPGPVVALARRFMTQPTHIRAADPDDTGATVRATAQFAYRAHALDKVEMLARILQARGRGLTIIFARTKRTAAKVAEDLDERGFASAAIHGDLGQGAREQALRAFRKGKIDVLVATDVAARGIDVDDVTHVINYQCPEDEKTYLHRIGRTGRAGNTGTAVTFVDWDEIPRWSLIDKALDLGIPEPVETYSSSPHLYSDLDIPAEVKGRLPEAARTRAGLDAEEVEDLGETGRGRRTGRGGPAVRRDRSTSKGRTAAGRAVDADAGPEEPTRPRRHRQRRRTRGGQLVSVDGVATGGAGEGTPSGRAGSSPSEPSGPEATTENGGDGPAPATTAPRSRRRRSRRTAGAGAATSTGTDAAAHRADEPRPDATGTEVAGPPRAPRAEAPIVDGPQALFLPPLPTTGTGPGTPGPDGGDDAAATGHADAARRRRRRGGRGRSGGEARAAGQAPTGAS